MASLTDKMRPRYVGRMWYRRVPLRSNEDVIMADRCLYQLPIWGWRLGKLFLTNQRLIWSPSWDLPQVFLQPRIILLSEITHVDTEIDTFTSNLVMPKRWRIETAAKTHYFSDGWGPFGQSIRRDDWILGIRDVIRRTDSSTPSSTA